MLWGQTSPTHFVTVTLDQVGLLGVSPLKFPAGRISWFGPQTFMRSPSSVARWRFQASQSGAVQIALRSCCDGGSPVVFSSGHHPPSSPSSLKSPDSFFALCFFCSHVIELRFIEHNLNRVVPTQIIVLGENCADLLFQIARHLDLGCFELFFRFFVYFAQLVAGVERQISLGKQVIVGDHLLDAVSLQLALDHCDQLIAGQGVKLDALIEQNGDLCVGRAVVGELFAQDILDWFWLLRLVRVPDRQCPQDVSPNR